MRVPNSFRSLRIPNYRRYFIGQVVSLSGTWAQTIGLGWLVLELSDDSGVAVGVVTAMQFVPVLLFACVVVAGTVFSVLTAGIGLLCLLPVICLLVLVFIPIGIIAHFAQFAVVLESMGPVDAFKRGWAILKTNLMNILILGMIVIVITAVLGLLLALPFLLIALPVIGAFIFGQGGQPDIAMLAIAGLCCACFVPVVIVMSGIMETWSTGVWTLAYHEFAGNTSAPAMPTAPMAPLAPLPPLPPNPPTPDTAGTPPVIPS